MVRGRPPESLTRATLGTPKNQPRVPQIPSSPSRRRRQRWQRPAAIGRGSGGTPGSSFFSRRGGVLQYEGGSAAMARHGRWSGGAAPDLGCGTTRVQWCSGGRWCGDGGTRKGPIWACPGRSVAPVPCWRGPSRPAHRSDSDEVRASHP
jgi:hypothetical protein